MQAHTGFKGTLVGGKTREGRQQGRMNVDHAPRPALDERRRHQPHEAGQDHEIDDMGLQPRLERRLEIRAAGEGLMVDRLGDEARFARTREAWRTGTV